MANKESLRLQNYELDRRCEHLTRKLEESQQKQIEMTLLYSKLQKKFERYEKICSKYIEIMDTCDSCYSLRNVLASKKRDKDLKALDKEEKDDNK